MIFDFILRWLRKEQIGSAPAIPEILESEESLDPNNPFPDVVVIPFRDVLDLHSIPPKQVRAVVEGYIEEAYEKGIRGVRIIHGKGIGVQREIVRSVLAEKPWVVEYSDAPPEAGGWGATVATLARSERTGDSA